MAFWGTDLGSADMKDPKRKFRFRVRLGTLGAATGAEDLIWYAKTVKKPEFSISGDTAHQFLGHKFYFPGTVSWEPITITMVDPADPDVARETLKMIQNAGYRFPKAPNIQETISKNKSVDALGSVVIEQIDAEGGVVEKWQLHNPFITKVSFGELSYAEEDLSEVTLDIRYDWATFDGLGENDSTANKFGEDPA